MRTGSPPAAGKVLAAVLMLTLAVAAGRSGDDPKPSVRPAAAKVAVEEKEQGRLVLLFREEVRYLTPTGKEIQRIDYTAAKKLDANIHTGTVTLGGPKVVEVQRFLPACGRTGPGGVVPLAANNGMKLLFPGSPPTVKGVAANENTEPVVGWEADGKHFVVRTAEVSAVWGVTEFKAFRVNAATGKREQLPFGPEYEVIDASADGTMYLTYRHIPRAFGLPGFSESGTAVCRLTREGKLIDDRGPADPSIRTGSFHRLSPDGGRSVECCKARMSATDAWQPSIQMTEYPLPGKAPGKGTMVHFHIAKPFDVECMGVAWSPDGKQLVSCWRPASWKDMQTWHVVVCDPAGQNLRTVATFESKADEQLRSVDWW